MKDRTLNSYLLSTVALKLEPCRVSFWRNVTEAKRTAQRIAQSEAMLRRTYERRAPDIIITRRADGPILRRQRQFVKRTGMAQEGRQALGTSMDNIRLFLRPEDRTEFVAQELTVVPMGSEGPLLARFQSTIPAWSLFRRSTLRDATAGAP